MQKVKNALYELEFDLDVFDTTIDKSDLNKCFTCTEESKIACCYRTVSTTNEAMSNGIELLTYLGNSTPML